MNNGSDNFGFKDAVKVEHAVLIATPCLSHFNAAEYTASLTETIWAFQSAGIGMGFKMIGGDCFVANVRNRLFTAFLETPCTDLFFIDDDTGWPWQAVIEMLKRPEEVVAGVCPKKNDDNEFPVELEVDPMTKLPIHRNGLYKAVSVGAAFMRLKRSAVLKMVESEEMWYEWYDAETRQRQKHKAFFEAGPNPNDRQWWGEDHAFSHKWRNLGGEIWIMPDITFTHTGRKRYTGNLSIKLAEVVHDIKARRQEPKQEAVLH